LAWDLQREDSSTFFQLTLSDMRDFGDQDGEYQMANIQASRNRTLNRRSSVSGNLTLQCVRQKFASQGEGDTVTTATGQVSYNHSRLLGVQRLRFASDLRLSRAATEQGVDRAEWENRLDYDVGLLDTRLSWRQIDTESEDFSLIYFQVTRRF
jgi:hypothetical protein